MVHWNHKRARMYKHCKKYGGRSPGDVASTWSPLLVVDDCVLGGKDGEDGEGAWCIGSGCKRGTIREGKGGKERIGEWKGRCCCYPLV